MDKHIETEQFQALLSCLQNGPDLSNGAFLDTKMPFFDMFHDNPFDNVLLQGSDSGSDTASERSLSPSVQSVGLGTSVSGGLLRNGNLAGSGITGSRGGTFSSTGSGSGNVGGIGNIGSAAAVAAAAAAAARAAAHSHPPMLPQVQSNQYNTGLPIAVPIGVGAGLNACVVTAGMAGAGAGTSAGTNTGAVHTHTNAVTGTSTGTTGTGAGAGGFASMFGNGLSPSADDEPQSEDSVNKPTRKSRKPQSGSRRGCYSHGTELSPEGSLEALDVSGSSSGSGDDSPSGASLPFGLLNTHPGLALPNSSSLLPLQITPGLAPSKIQELLQEQELKKRRLARKAELARASRKRKKTRIDELEHEVALLKSELEASRKAHRKGEKVEVLNGGCVCGCSGVCSGRTVQGEGSLSDGGFPGSAGQRSRILRTWDKTGLEATVSEIASAAPQLASHPNQQVQQRLAVLTEKLIQENKAKLEATEGLLDALSNSLAPTTVGRFLEWALAQSDKFYLDPRGLWNSLFVSELGATPAQRAAIQALRIPPNNAGGRVLAENLAEVTTQLKSSLHRSEGALERVATILTPLQLAKLLKWIQQFGDVCVKINL